MPSKRKANIIDLKNIPVPRKFRARSIYEHLIKQALALGDGQAIHISDATKSEMQSIAATIKYHKHPLRVNTRKNDDGDYSVYLSKKP